MTANRNNKRSAGPSGFLDEFDALAAVDTASLAGTHVNRKPVQSALSPHGDGIRIQVPPGFSSQTQPAGWPVGSEAYLAWALADSAASFFSADEHTSVYVELGAGETLLAIQHVLEIAVRKAQPLPAVLVSMVTHWLDGYVESQHEPVLRRLLTNVQPAVTPAHQRERR